MKKFSLFLAGVVILCVAVAFISTATTSTVEAKEDSKCCCKSVSHTKGDEPVYTYSWKSKTACQNSPGGTCVDGLNCHWNK